SLVRARKTREASNSRKASNSTKASNSRKDGAGVRIYVSSVFVDDQDKALAFYSRVLGFVKKTEVPLGDHRWLTVVAPADPEGTELLLELDGPPAVKPFKEALVADGIPFTSFAVADIHGGI